MSRRRRRNLASLSPEILCEALEHLPIPDDLHAASSVSARVASKLLVRLTRLIRTASRDASIQMMAILWGVAIALRFHSTIDESAVRSFLIALPDSSMRPPSPPSPGNLPDFTDWCEMDAAVREARVLLDPLLDVSLLRKPRSSSPPQLDLVQDPPDPRTRLDNWVTTLHALVTCLVIDGPGHRRIHGALERQALRIVRELEPDDIPAAIEAVSHYAPVVWLYAPGAQDYPYHVASFWSATPRFALRFAAAQNRAHDVCGWAFRQLVPRIEAGGPAAVLALKLGLRLFWQMPMFEDDRDDSWFTELCRLVPETLLAQILTAALEIITSVECMATEECAHLFQEATDLQKEQEFRDLPAFQILRSSWCRLVTECYPLMPPAFWDDRWTSWMLSELRLPGSGAWFCCNFLKMAMESGSVPHQVVIDAVDAVADIMTASRLKGRLLLDYSDLESILLAAAAFWQRESQTAAFSSLLRDKFCKVFHFLLNDKSSDAPALASLDNQLCDTLVELGWFTCLLGVFESDRSIKDISNRLRDRGSRLEKLDRITSAMRCNEISPEKVSEIFAAIRSHISKPSGLLLLNADLCQLSSVCPKTEARPLLTFLLSLNEKGAELSDEFFEILCVLAANVDDGHSEIAGSITAALIKKCDSDFYPWLSRSSWAYLFQSPSLTSAQEAALRRIVVRHMTSNQTRASEWGLWRVQPLAEAFPVDRLSSSDLRRVWMQIGDPADRQPLPSPSPSPMQFLEQSLIRSLPRPFVGLYSSQERFHGVDWSMVPLTAISRLGWCAGPGLWRALLDAANLNESIRNDLAFAVRHAGVFSWAVLAAWEAVLGEEPEQ
ncbi:hypothetical protein DFJ73DRAFT_832491 [Zopfochytrium polystomum]|nr:hypothetical protein DFJ73DRAFT_832491 [Zopfochytrium polystomum]